VTKCQSKVVTERLGWGSVGNGLDERLLIRLSSSKAIEADLVVRKINLDPYETVRPERINQVRPQEDLDGTAVVGAAQEDNRSLERQLEIKFPALRERAAWRGRVETRCRSVPCGLHKAIRLLRKGGKIFVFEADPDLRLPAAIVVFNGGLKSGFPWEARRPASRRAANRDGSRGRRRPDTFGCPGRWCRYRIGRIPEDRARASAQSAFRP
jgi:hypothetical protein